MQFKKLASLITILLMVVFVAGCSSDDDNPTDPGNGNGNGDDPPTIEIEQITLPQAMTQSNDPQAQQTVGMVQSLNGFRTFASVYFAPQTQGGKAGKVSGTQDWNYTWTEGNLTIMWHAWEDGNMYRYEITLDGTDDDGTTYNNFLFLEAHQTQDGKSGEMYFYDPEASGAFMTFTWQEDASGVLNMNWTTNEGSQSTTLDLIYYNDMSGEIEQVVGGTLRYRAEWTANGAGEWWTYDENGNQLDNGTWSP